MPATIAACAVASSAGSAFQFVKPTTVASFPMIARGIQLERAAIADDGDAAALGDQVEISHEIDVREHLDDQVDAAPAGLRQDVLLVAGRRMVEHLVRALLARELSAPLGSRRAEDAQSGGARYLRGGDADGAACAVNQHRLARDRAPFVEERAPCGDIRNADAGAFGKRHVVRKVMNLIDRADGALRVRAVTRGRRSCR